MPKQRKLNAREREVVRKYSEKLRKEQAKGQSKSGSGEAGDGDPYDEEGIWNLIKNIWYSLT